MLPPRWDTRLLRNLSKHPWHWENTERAPRPPAIFPLVVISIGRFREKRVRAQTDTEAPLPNIAINNLTAAVFVNKNVPAQIKGSLTRFSYWSPWKRRGRCHLNPSKRGTNLIHHQRHKNILTILHGFSEINVSLLLTKKEGSEQTVNNNSKSQVIQNNKNGDAFDLANSAPKEYPGLFLGLQPKWQASGPLVPYGRCHTNHLHLSLLCCLLHYCSQGS